MECFCDDWKENIDKVNAPILLQQARNPHHKFTAKVFGYCPWCGDILHEHRTSTSTGDGT
jgi:hypothetical protein